MLFPLKIVPESWYHKEHIVGEKGGLYLFRKKWILIVQAVSLIAIVPLVVFIWFFYQDNRIQAINDLLEETAILIEDSAIDFEIFLKQYVLSLRIVTSMYSVYDLLRRDVFRNIFISIRIQKNDGRLLYLRESLIISLFINF